MTQEFKFLPPHFKEDTNNSTYYFLFSADEVGTGKIMDIGDLTEEEQAMMRMEDCEVFQCKVASLGRKAYNLVSSGLRQK